jgi:hypothetical protein
MPFLVASCVSMDRVAADCSNDLDQYRGTADRIADRYCGGATVKQFPVWYGGMWTLEQLFPGVPVLNSLQHCTA